MSEPNQPPKRGRGRPRKIRPIDQVMDAAIKAIPDDGIPLQAEPDGVTWDTIPEGEDPLFKKGTLPDGRRIHVPRREPTPEELKRIDELVEFNKGYVPTVADIAVARRIEQSEQFQAESDPQGSSLALEPPATTPTQPVPATPFPEPNAVIQVTQGDDRGMLWQVGVVEGDTVYCYRLLTKGEKDFGEVKMGEFTLISQPRRGMVAWKYQKPQIETAPDWHEPPA